MHAVIQTGGKQYRVKEGDIFFVEKLPGEANSQVVFDQVLLVSQDEGDDAPQIGAPYLEKARVACEIIEQFRGKKILVYKFQRRKKVRKRKGHRQHYTRLRVLEIAADGNLTGKRPAKKAAKDSAPVGFEDSAVSQDG